MSNQVKFVVGGTVQAGQGTYLERPADKQLLDACRNKKFAFVLACRQIGKSSLIVSTAKKLQDEGVKTVIIDLTSIGSNIEKADNWYFYMAQEFLYKLELEFDIETWWDERIRLSVIQRFQFFLREVVLKKIIEDVVVFLDEIDVTLDFKFGDEFFAMIRAIYNSRDQYQVYERLTFVLSGVATPDQLIANPAHTPFNIGQRIDLEDFTRETCLPFQNTLEAKCPRYSHVLFKEIYDWTNGHPYLIQKLSEAVFNSSDSYRENLVHDLVDSLFMVGISGDLNINFVQKMVLNDSYAQEMLKVYERLLVGHQSVRDDETSIPISRLKLYGLVVARDGVLQIRNTLYERVFDTVWIAKNLEAAQYKLAAELQEELDQTKSELTEVQQQNNRLDEERENLKFSLNRKQELIDDLQQQRTRQIAATKIAIPIFFIIAFLSGLGWYYFVFLRWFYG